jgi:hypothetical protein
MESSRSKGISGGLSTCGGKDLKMETERSRKRDSAHKKSDFSVYSQKAVRAKERLQRVKPVVIQKSNDNGKDNGPYGTIGQKSCVVKVKNAMKQKDHLLKTKDGS